MSFELHAKVFIFHHFDESVSKVQIVKAIKPNWTIEIIGLLTDTACTLSNKLSSGDELSWLFLYEVRAELIVTTWVAIVNVTNFSSALTTFFFPPINSDKDSEIEIGLETDHWYNIFAVSTCGWAYCRQDNS